MIDSGIRKKMKKMETKEIINVLERYNRWRKGADIPMENPKVLGDAIDGAIKVLKMKMETE